MNKAAKWSVIILSASAISFAAGASASGLIQKVEAYVRSDYTVNVNGKKVELSSPPLIYQNKSYIPLADFGAMLDIDVNFAQKSKTIYVNSHISHDPLQDHTTGLETEQFALDMAEGYPVGYLFSYSGRDYPVFGFLDYTKNAEYYRLSDLKKMGLDLNGLRLAKEKYTGELYVRKEEVNGLWLEKPTVTSAPVPLAVGESDQGKITALLGLGEAINSFGLAPQFIQIFLIDKISDEDEYRLLAFTNGYLTEYDAQLGLTKNYLPDGTVAEKWYFKKYSTTLLQTPSNAEQMYR
ncbi:MAG TPA: stalk domain-containing protein [Bacilli bacterium]